MSTSTHPPSLRVEDSARSFLSGRLEEDDAAIDDTLFDDGEWEESHEGWLIDQTLEDSGIVINQDHNG
jgi:hypothetical protein